MRLLKEPYTSVASCFVTVCCERFSNFRGSYHLQLLEQRILWRSLFGRFGHVEVQRVSVPQSVQTQHEGYVVLQQTGVYGEREGKVR